MYKRPHQASRRALPGRSLLFNRPRSKTAAPERSSRGGGKRRPPAGPSGHGPWTGVLLGRPACGARPEVIRPEKGISAHVGGMVSCSAPKKELVYDARKDIDAEASHTDTAGYLGFTTENHGRVDDLHPSVARSARSVRRWRSAPALLRTVAKPGNRGHAQSAGSHDERPLTAAQSSACAG